MTIEQIKLRIEQTAKLRDICKANGNKEGYMAHNNRLARLHAMLCEEVEKRSIIRLYACAQV
jgi:hypothetical protein